MRNKIFLRPKTTLIILAALCITTLGIFLLTLMHGHLMISNSEVQIDNPNEFTSDLMMLRTDNIGDLQEISQIAIKEDYGVIVGLSESSDDKTLLILFSDGKLIKWDNVLNKIVAEFNLSAADRKYSGFNEDGSLVFTYGGLIKSGDDAGDKGGYQLFGTKYGNLVSCYASPKCNDNIEEESVNDFPIDGLFLLQNGKLLISYHNQSIRIVPVVKEYGFPSGYSAPDLESISRIAIAPSKKYIAIARSDGSISIQDFSMFANIDINTGSEISTQSPGDKNIIETRLAIPSKFDSLRDLAFDPSNIWLAALTDKELVTWSLQKLIFSRYIVRPIKNGNMISFDRTGNILALATQDGISIFSMKRGELVSTLDVGNVVFLYFAPDNRLLVWGDSEGNVHFWGVPR
ncbi:MAG: hypothetical protein HYZ25_01445 [Chloroflexi bacterium]|nr:hypothetical protein [Chloroflexota bacterium]